jgi:glycosyltransferase involved in cell wall biosynthesis
MKILYLVHQFYPEFQSGTEKVILNNALMAQQSGNKVKVITYSFYEDTFYEKEKNGILSREFIYKGIPVIAFKYKNQPINLHISLESRALNGFAEEVIKSESPDIVHVGHSMRVHEFIRVARERNIPYLLTLTDFFLLCPKVILAPNDHSLCSGPKNGTACRNLCKEFSEDFISNRLKTAQDFLKNSKAIVAPSKFVANIYKQEFNELNIYIVNHGIQYKYIKQNNRTYASGDKLVFGYAGNLSYHKGIHILLRAFSGIKDDNIKLILYGSGQDSYVSKLKETAKNDARISFYEVYSSEQLGDIFCGMDMLVTPSISYESYLLVLHEALACNVPVIASDLGGMSERIKDGFNGFTFKPGISEDLKSKMELIINDVSVLNKLKENIRDKMVIPTIEQESYSYYRIYNSICSV